jgi:hypothetical protein
MISPLGGLDPHKTRTIRAGSPRSFVRDRKRKSLILKWRRGRDSNPRGLAPIPVFKTGAFNRSATPPVSAFRGLP